MKAKRSTFSLSKRTVPMRTLCYTWCTYAEATSQSELGTSVSVCVFWCKKLCIGQRVRHSMCEKAVGFTNYIFYCQTCMNSCSWNVLRNHNKFFFFSRNDHQWSLLQVSLTSWGTLVFVKVIKVAVSSLPNFFLNSLGCCLADDICLCQSMGYNSQKHTELDRFQVILSPNYMNY